LEVKIVAYILNRSYVLAQLAVVGVLEADLAAMTADGKVAALLAVANASAGAVAQAVSGAELAVGAQSLVTGEALTALSKAQLAALAALAPGPAPGGSPGAPGA
jgi:hypothetical protein